MWDWDLFRARRHQLPSFTVLFPALCILLFSGKPQVEDPCDLDCTHITLAALSFAVCWVPVHTRQHFGMGGNDCLPANVAEAVRGAVTA